jgi:molecular chaperone GrpE
MADDRWSDADDAARAQWDAGPEAPDSAEEGLEALRSERDARAREAAEARDRYLRTLAEFDNSRRRTGREREDWRRQAQEELLREILPVLDNFDRALAAAPPAGADQAFRTGVELIHRNFLAALERVGVRPFVAVGEPFDPMRHEAVGRIERQDVEDQTVVAETLRGYLLQDRVLRPAQVVVAVHPAAAPAGGEGAD